GIPPVQQRLIFGGKQMYVSFSSCLILEGIITPLPRHASKSPINGLRIYGTSEPGKRDDADG
ncbi:hypothetical protein B0O99DRAFT_647334, partial [Bisporella sp. PMI_857]